MSKGARWDSSTWTTYSDTHIKNKSTAKIYSRSTIKSDFNPLSIKIRESRDSELYPVSNAIIVGLDVTGSMHTVLDSMARKGLPTLCEEIYSRKPVTDPHIMCMGIGDVEMGDRAPLQATQFEGDIKIAEQLVDIYLEGGGGGNGYESYNLPWYFAGMYTSIDCFEKRGKKGYLFTVGDEDPPQGLASEYLRSVFKNAPDKDLKLEEMLALATRMYHVYHVIVEEGDHTRYYGSDKVYKKWSSLLGQNVIRLSDHTKLAEVIVSAIEMNEGKDKDEVIQSWDGSTSIVMAHAFGNSDIQKSKEKSGIVTFD